MKYQSLIFLINAINSSIDMDLPPFITYASVAVFIHTVTKPLLPAYIVFIMTYYMRICGSIGYYFMRALTNLLAANVSCSRIQVG